MTCPDCERSAARLRELQDELDAWRSADAYRAETEVEALRLARWQLRLDRLRPVPTRLLILLADAPGRIVSLDRCAGLSGRDVDRLTSPITLAFNTACHARSALKALGLSDAILTVRGLGYCMVPAAAARLRHLMGDFEGCEP